MTTAPITTPAHDIGDPLGDRPEIADEHRTEDVRFVGDDLGQHRVGPCVVDDELHHRDDGVGTDPAIEGCGHEPEQAMQVPSQEQPGHVLDRAHLPVDGHPGHAGLRSDIGDACAGDPEPGETGRRGVEVGIEPLGGNGWDPLETQMVEPYDRRRLRRCCCTPFRHHVATTV